VIDAGLIWIGPSPQSIRDLGDKVTARHIAERANAPMAAGTKDPVANAEEVIAFAEEYGVPVAIKAAYGGGGRGMKVAHSFEEIPHLFQSATREAIAAFGRGECFVEQYLDKARHVEAQVIADQHGNVVVAGTRDCSLQRRFQKLVEEAPAPFLTDDQRRRIHESAKAICREAHYYGAGTVEYLVQGDTVSFLEVNTRLQVEHPVTEEPPASTSCASSSASPTANTSTSPRIPPRAATHSSSASTARTPAAVSFPVRDRCAFTAHPLAPACASTPEWSPAA
jgi:acetyl-CoA/propionyl-CoA carboxylase biotin carboxyl carrier protein